MTENWQGLQLNRFKVLDGYKIGQDLNQYKRKNRIIKCLITLTKIKLIKKQYIATFS